MTSFKRNLALGYSFSIVLLLAGSIASLISIRGLLRSMKDVERTNLVISKLERAISSLKDAETGQRGYLLTGDKEFLTPFNGALDSVQVNIKEIRELTRKSELQQISVMRLADVVENRMTVLTKVIEAKQAGKEMTLADLQEGKMHMDAARKLVDQMQSRERQMLESGMEATNSFAQRTPMFIIIATLLAMLITLLSYMRLSGDFKRRLKLQQQLLEKDREVSERINIISAIAEKVSGGDYTATVEERYEDKLGNLAQSLNKMTASLHESFLLLKNKEWLQTGISRLNERMLGEQTVESLAVEVVNELVQYSGADVGAFYYVHDGQLQFEQGYAFVPDARALTIKPGEGLAGQALVSKKWISVTRPHDQNIDVDYTTGKMKAAEVIALPFVFEGQVLAVAVLGGLRMFDQREKEYLETIANNIAIVINTANTRNRLNELLRETQAQSRELSIQHATLESINAELEEQSMRLKSSEEELKAQQEELIQSNSELEERSRLLEERNMLIAEQNRDIRQQAEQLRISSKYKSEFLANMSHELRTPLNSILLLSRLLSDNAHKNLSSEQVDYANVIRSAGQGLLSLIDEILDLSKIEAGKMDLDVATAEVQEIAVAMQTLFEPVSKDKGIAFKVEIDPNVPERLETDRLRVEQVLKNLLSNAFKFTAKGHVSLKVSMKDDHKISFEVEDTGIGIAADKQQLVFEAFRQEDGSTRRNYGGTGLGLSISRELAQLLGGQLTLESVPGKGSRFTLLIPSTIEANIERNSIPRHSGSHQQVTAVVQPVLPEAAIPDDRDKLEFGDKIILIIEDDKVFAEMLLEFSRSNGYKGLVAVTGDTGLQLAKMYKPLGILLDIYLPVMDGWAVIKALKEDRATRQIPVHVISSVGQREEELAPGVEFSGKPISSEDMDSLFKKITHAVDASGNKVLVVEENSMHAKALAIFLEQHEITTAVAASIQEAGGLLSSRGRAAIILDSAAIPGFHFSMLGNVKSVAGLEQLPVILFSTKPIAASEEAEISKYVDSVVLKSAQSYKRMLDEISIFLKLVDPARNAGDHNNSLLREVLAHRKILIVDDDVRNIYSLTKALEIYGVQVVTAIDGEDAIRQLEANRDVELILMDMMMPGMDGYDTMRHIRRLPQYERLPIIAITAKAMPEDREKCVEAGASDYISKPVDTDQLISLLRVWLYADH